MNFEEHTLCMFLICFCFEHFPAALCRNRFVFTLVPLVGSSQDSVSCWCFCQAKQCYRAICRSFATWGIGIFSVKSWRFCFFCFFCSMRTIDPYVLIFDSDSFSGCDDFTAKASWNSIKPYITYILWVSVEGVEGITKKDECDDVSFHPVTIKGGEQLDNSDNPIMSALFQLLCWSWQKTTSVFLVKQW